MNPEGHRFRPDWKQLPPNVRRVCAADDINHEPSHFTSDVVADRINYPSVDNNSQGSAENLLCLISENFDLDKLFNEYEGF